MRIYVVILEGWEHGEVDALEFACEFDWMECPLAEQDKPTHSRYIDTVNGVSVYYDYGADYYFFEEEEA